MPAGTRACAAVLTSALHCWSLSLLRVWFETGGPGMVNSNGSVGSAVFTGSPALYDARCSSHSHEPSSAFDRSHNGRNLWRNLVLDHSDARCKDIAELRRYASDISEGRSKAPHWRKAVTIQAREPSQTPRSETRDSSIARRRARMVPAARGPD